MALKRCPHCGEKYSDTYKNCPFCEEEEALRGGRKIRRSGKRTGGKRQINLLTPTLFVLILIMGALLLYLLFGDRFQKDPAREENKPSVEEVKEMILRHGRMMIEFKGEMAGMREMRKHVAWYTAGYPNSAALRNDINTVETLDELVELIGSRL